MARTLRSALALATLILPTWALYAATDIAVPASCTAAVNQQLSALVASGGSHAVDNVMVCGTTVSPSRTQRGGRHGSHQILPLGVHMTDGSLHLVEVVTNDELDGVVTAPKGAQVYAFGQAFFS